MADQLVQCRVCGANVAASARRCPQCGARPPRDVMWWLSWLAVIVAVWMVLAVLVATLG